MRYPSVTCCDATGPRYGYVRGEQGYRALERPTKQTVRSYNGLQQPLWCPTARLARLRPCKRRPELPATLLPGSDPGSPLAILVWRISEAPCFFDWVFFCSRWWDSLIALVGHLPRRWQELSRDGVSVAATGPSLPGDDAIFGQLGEMPGYRRFADAGDSGQRPD